MELKPCPFCGEMPDFELIPKIYVFSHRLLDDNHESTVTLRVKCKKCNIMFGKSVTGSLSDGIPFNAVMHAAWDAQDMWDRRVDNANNRC